MMTRINSQIYLYEEHQTGSRANLQQFYLSSHTLYQTNSNTIVDQIPAGDRMTEIVRLIHWIWNQHRQKKENESEKEKEKETILVFCPTKARCEQVIRMMIQEMVSE